MQWRTAKLALAAMLPALMPIELPAASGCDNLSGLPIHVGVQWPEVWTALNQQAGCTQNCHLGGAPSGDLDLSNPQISIYFLVGQPSSQDFQSIRVEPGNPAASLLMQKIGCSKPDVGSPMPPPNGHLPIALQGLVYDWIDQGAYGEDAEDPIWRDFIFRASMETLRQ